jgi:hypothetical protein
MVNKRILTTGMGEIEKRHILESQNLDIRKINFSPESRNLISFLVKISLFRMKKFEISKPIQYETFFQ